MCRRLTELEAAEGKGPTEGSDNADVAEDGASDADGTTAAEDTAAVTAAPSAGAVATISKIPPSTPPTSPEVPSKPEGAVQDEPKLQVPSAFARLAIVIRSDMMSDSGAVSSLESGQMAGLRAASWHLLPSHRT